jgi:hypothetical protein
MSGSTTHITASGGLISAAFIENIRQPGSRQRGVDPASFAVGRGASAPWSEAPRNPAALEMTIATAWELLLERWDAVRNDLPMMEVSQVRSRWLLPLFELLDFSPVYLRGDTVLDEAGKLRFPLSHRGWEEDARSRMQDAPVIHTVAPAQDLDGRMAAGRGASTGSSRRIKAKSPHDMLQAFLNASPTDHWAVLSNAGTCWRRSGRRCGRAGSRIRQSTPHHRRSGQQGLRPRPSSGTRSAARPCGPSWTGSTPTSTA